MTHNDRDLTGKAFWLLGFAAIPAVVATGFVVVASRRVWQVVQDAITEAYKENQYSDEW